MPQKMNNAVSDLPFSTERLAKIVHYMYYTKKDDIHTQNKTIPDTLLTIQDGMTILQQFAVSLKNSVRMNACDCIIIDIVTYLSGANGDDADIQNMLLFNFFLTNFLYEDELFEFCLKIQTASPEIISETNRRHLLLQFGSKLGFQ